MSVKSVFLKGLMVAGLVLGCEQTVEPVVITFDSNNGTLSAVEQEVMPGEPVKLKANSFTYEGYDFVEWNEKSDGSGKKYPDGGEITVNAALILFAQWSPVKPQKPQDVETFLSGTTVKLTLTAPTDAFWDKVVVRQNSVDVQIFEREDLGSYDASNPPTLTYTAENLTDGNYVFEVVVYNQETASDPVTEEVTIGSGGGVTDPDPEDPSVEGEVFDVTAGEASFDEADGLTLPFTAGEGFVMPEAVTLSVTLTAGEDQVPVTENVAFKEDKTAVIVPAASLTVGNYTAVTLTLSADGYASKTLDYSYSFTVAEEPDATEISNLTASPADESVVLTWTLPTGEFDSFVISCSSDTDPAEIADQTISNNTATTHTFTGLQNGGSYTFTVKTVSGGQNSAGVSKQVSLPNIPETIERGGKTLRLVKGFDFDSSYLLTMEGSVATGHPDAGNTPVKPNFNNPGFFSFTTTADVSSRNYQYPLEIGQNTATYAEIRFSYKGNTPAGSVGLGTTSTKDGEGINNNGWRDEFLYTNKGSDSTNAGTLYFRCHGGSPGVLAYDLDGGHSPGMWIRSGIDFSGGTRKTYYVQGDPKNSSMSNDHDLSSKSKYWLYIGQEADMTYESTITLDWIAFYAEEPQQ